MLREKRKHTLWIALLAMLAIAVGGCGHSGLSRKNINQPERDRLSQELSLHREIFAERGVQLKSSYSTNERIVIEVRKSKAPWEALSTEETERLKQDLYEIAGYTFDLRIDSFVMPKQADITGTITALDGNRVLVVGEAKAGSNSSATWVRFPSGLAEELRIGYQINAWSDGMFEESYPVQTSGLQLQVVEFEAGKGEHEGTITDLSLDDTDVAQRYIEVDQRKYRLLPYTKYKANGETGAQENLNIGDNVQVWTLGYEIVPEEKFASQINVLSSP
ncbi:DUF3221 domain-containing protein [Cohnella panacarvi]|uniref:DUF3221 domain-containing protein n=1 Tax=Cohnella panacarvi TaxID=400776 RepID=UPI00047D81D7|nr:DUF3221 domain-containing protein [Cohnella panacarvi]